MIPITKIFNVKIFLILFILPSILCAQVGIGNSNPKATLDISASNIVTPNNTDGILIPRIDDFPTIDPATDQDGLLLFVTGNGTPTKGFYYWNNSDWIALAGESDDDWKKEGNAGTTPGTDYIGTSDAQDLYIATNGTDKIRVLNDGRVSVNGAPNFSTDKFTVNSDSGESGINSYSTDGTAIYGFDSGTGIGVMGSSATGYGIASFSQTSGIYNEVSSGFGQYNNILSDSFGTLTELTTSGGTGEIVDLGVQDGIGFLFYGLDNPSTPTNGGDVYGFQSRVYTTTPTTSGSVYGSAFVGQQYGLGHGILLTHSGDEGRNAEFNITNSSNPDPAIFSVHEGDGSVIIGQNHNNSISGVLTVADFAYTGTDTDDHYAVSGFSAPSSGWGIGVYGYGGWFGVYGQSTSAGYALFGSGDTGATGTKSFVIDHPDDPANKILKHFSIESDEILNLYRGTEEFDSNGIAKVSLPNYYKSINKDPSYQLTPVGASMPDLFIQKEINESGIFIIGGGVPGKKVSWTITSQRNDPYLKQNPEKRFNVIDKGDKSGKYLTPLLYNQPKENGINFKENKEIKTSKTDNSKANKAESFIKELNVPEKLKIDQDTDNKN